jgi:hypothetical protein
MTITVQPSLWINLRPGDTSFRLNDNVSVTDRASIELTGRCPHTYVNLIAMAIKQQWIQPVAAVPRTDPTLMWDRLKKRET